MRLRVLALALVLTSSVSLAGVVRPGAEPQSRPGAWSSQALRLSSPKPGAQGVFPSPDGQKTVASEDVDLYVEVKGKRVFHATHPISREILWSPDSLAFAVTWNEGGAEGTWSFAVYLVLADGVKEVEVAPPIVQDFLPRFRCTDPEIPDVGAVGWLGGASELMVAARVPRHQGCADAGMMIGYQLVMPSGRVSKTYTATELKEKHRALLGPELLGD